MLITLLKSYVFDRLAQEINIFWDGDVLTFLKTGRSERNENK